MLLAALGGAACFSPFRAGCVEVESPKTLKPALSKGWSRLCERV